MAAWIWIAFIGAESSANAQEALVPSFLTARTPVDGSNVEPPTIWSVIENVLWKTDIPGLAWSSPIVVGRKVFVTTCVSAGVEYEPRKGLYMEDLDARKYKPINDKHVWKLLCLNIDDGSILWEQTAEEAVPAKPHHIKNTLASETPCTDGERVYAHFGNVGLFCYDLDGNKLWERRVEPKETRYGWGTSQSPIVHDGVVYLVNDNEEESWFEALDAKTGKALWHKPREEKTNYSTPFVWETPERKELVISGIGWCNSYTLDGEPLWQIKGKSILAIPTPFDYDGLLYVTSGHVLWGESPMYVVKPGATGDLSPKENEPASPYLAWHHPGGGPYHPTPLVVDDLMYVLLDRGILSCYDAKTGEVVYEKKRLPARGFTTSPFAYSGKLFCLSEDGIAFVVPLGREFKVESANELAEDDMCMATPVIVGDKLLIRTSERIYCIGAH